MTVLLFLMGLYPSCQISYTIGFRSGEIVSSASVAA